MNGAGGGGKAVRGRPLYLFVHGYAHVQHNVNISRAIIRSCRCCVYAKIQF